MLKAASLDDDDLDISLHISTINQVVALSCCRFRCKGSYVTQATL